MHTIKTIILSLGALLCGCAVDGTELEAPVPAALVVPAEPAPASYAYEVDIDPAFNDADVEAILAGIESWNKRIGREGLKPVMATLVEPSDWHIRVSLMTRAESAAFDGPSTVGLPPVAGWTGGNGLFCEVKLVTNAPPVVAAHEIGGHCFDIEHSNIEGNFMNEAPTVPEVNITDEQVSLILGRLDGNR
jgi:hypothetical protein